MGRKRHVCMSVNPGEPTDGTGRVCVHLFVRDEENGSFVEPHVLHPAFDELGNRIKQKVVARQTRGHLACDLKRQVAPVTRNGITTVTSRTEELSAVTCQKCIASKDYIRLISASPVT